MNLAIIGATGLVGGEYLRIIAAAQHDITELIPVASSRSAGSSLPFNGQDVTVRDLERFDFADCDAALFCVGDELSRRYVPDALAAGAMVVDKSNAYRMDPQVPLVVGGVNDEAIMPNAQLVANPNCSTIILCHGLQPLTQFGLRRVWVATYQSMSGAGREGIERLRQQTAAAVYDEDSGRADGDEAGIANNVIPGIGGIDAQLRCSEESKLLNETRKILGNQELQLVPHAVRVPVSIGHSMAVSVELERRVTMDQLIGAWDENDNVRFRTTGLPNPLSASRHVQVEAGRLRAEEGLENGWSFFLSGDNVSLGAALNGWRLLALLRVANGNQLTKAG